MEARSPVGTSRHPMGSPGIRRESLHQDVPLETVDVKLTTQAQLLQTQWPLFTPVLLALAESEEPTVKSRGLKILAQFVEACPSKVLWTTGIGQIFQDVAFPALLHLPGINSDIESNQILTPAYEVLIKLADSYPAEDPKKRQLLDKVLRDGVLDGYQHASQHAEVVKTLLQYGTSIINLLGIYSTKHLQVTQPPTL